ncbi:hypothetical protein [Prevotella sp.]|uniref:hypothetical protein n=1 Tax=Prevotella sp. TaxID=59823 RepID=UPI002F939F09
MSGFAILLKIKSNVGKYEQRYNNNIRFEKLLFENYFWAAYLWCGCRVDGWCWGARKRKAFRQILLPKKRALEMGQIAFGVGRIGLWTGEMWG